MWRMRAIVSAIALALATAVHSEPSQYLCITEQATGLHYDDQSKAWHPQVFTPGERYSFRHLTDDEKKFEQIVQGGIMARRLTTFPTIYGGEYLNSDRSIHGPIVVAFQLASP